MQLETFFVSSVNTPYICGDLLYFSVFIVGLFVGTMFNLVSYYITVIIQEIITKPSS